MGKLKEKRAFPLVQWGKTWGKGLPSTGVQSAKLIRQEQEWNKKSQGKDWVRA